MKLLFFNDYRLGVLKGERVVDVTQVVLNVPHTGPGNLINGVIEHWAGDLRTPVEAVPNATRHAIFCKCTNRRCHR